MDGFSVRQPIAVDGRDAFWNLPGQDLSLRGSSHKLILGRGEIIAPEQSQRPEHSRSIC